MIRNGVDIDQSLCYAFSSGLVARPADETEGDLGAQGVKLQQNHLKSIMAGSASELPDSASTARLPGSIECDAAVTAGAAGGTRAMWGQMGQTGTT